jgi:energy-coupling factor transport system substrate-specific component
MTTTYPTTGPAPLPDTRWRTRDIMIAAVIGVAFGVAFWAIGIAWRALEGAGPILNVAYGIWLMPAIVAPLIIRKPGAALFAEMVAAGLSALLGSVWSVDTLLSGFVQGAAAELVFAFTLYRVWSFPVLALAGLAASAAAFIHDVALYFSEYTTDALVVIAIAMAISGAIILPLASVALVRSLRRSGVLEGFPD